MDADMRDVAMSGLVRDSGAIRDTVRVVREKRQGDAAVVAATFRRSSGRLMRGVVGFRRFDDSGWQTGGGWSSEPRHVPADAIWASSGGWGSGTRSRGVMGGWVNGSDAIAIRVTDDSGRTEEDTIEAGVAILIWEGDFDVLRATAALLDQDGTVIRSGPMHRSRTRLG